MIDTSDDAVFAALQLLDRVTASAKPLMFWVGAGISASCGYPLWHDFALKCHEGYVTTEPTYDREKGARLLQERSYPALFSVFKKIKSEHFISILKQEFGPRQITPTYERFLLALQRYSPLRIVTTNIDECLEQHLPNSATVQRSDLPHAITLHGQSKPFIAKLHGSISAVETTVFCEEEYEALASDDAYLSILNFGARQK